MNANPVHPLSSDSGNAVSGEQSPSTSTCVQLLDTAGEEVRKDIRDRIERRLKRLCQPEVTKLPVVRDLERDLRSADDDSEFADSEDPIPVILDALIDHRNFRYISVLSTIYDECCKESERAAKIVAEIVDEVTPLMFPPEFAIRIWDEIKVEQAAMFRPVNQNLAAKVPWRALIERA